MVAVLAVIVTVDGGHLTIGPEETLRPVPHQDAFDCSGCGQYQTALSVQGNHLVRADGTVVLLKGIMAPNPETLAKEGRFGRELFTQIRATGANVVRIPLDAEAWRIDPDYLWRYVDRAVTWAGETGMYAIVDLHMIGNIDTGAGQIMPGGSARSLAQAFWRQTAAYLRACPHVIFEVFNEPQGISAGAWRDAARNLVGIIRDQKASQTTIVGGIDFSSDLSWVLDEPVAGENIAYAVHRYPGSALSPDNSFGLIADRYPVLMTEWGFMDENPSPKQSYLNGNAAEFAAPLMAYLQAHAIGWVACWWDDSWEPPMLRPAGTGYTRFGDFVLTELRADHDLTAIPQRPLLRTDRPPRTIR